MFGVSLPYLAPYLIDVPLLDVNRPGYTSPTTHANRRATKTYQPNGKRECARRLRQWPRIEERKAV